MKLTIETLRFQSLINKAMKGASNNKMLPITGLISIKAEDGTLTLTTTDATNYLYVSSPINDTSDFSIVVQAEIFVKLILKLTCEFVTLSVDGDRLTVEGNGTYHIELPLDEEGKLISYPDPVNESPFDEIESGTIMYSTIYQILNTAKASIATTLDVPCYTGYYVGENVIATDTYKICGIDTPVFDEPALISSELMDLVGLCDAEEIDYVRGEKHIIFSTENTVVYGTLMDEIDDFQIDVIEGLLDTEFNDVCKLPRQPLLQLLNRLSLFVGIYDRNAIDLHFGKDGLTVTSKQANSTEKINYVTYGNLNEFDCSIDIEALHSQIQSNTGDAIDIHFGEDSAIKVTRENVTQVIALLED